MPLPFILGAGAAIAGIVGVKKGVEGAASVKEAKNTLQEAEERHQENIEKFERQSEKTSKAMDELGKLELNILKSFEEFSDTIEKIQNRPQFKKYSKDGIEIPEYEGEDLKQVSIGAGVLLGGLAGAALGTAGGFAASGATTTAVMALGTASTGTVISALSGAAATNATLAALGGGATTKAMIEIPALGISLGTAGGMSLGATILGATTLGVGILVGGTIFSATGSKLSTQADKAWSEMKKAEKTMNKIDSYLGQLKNIADKYRGAMKKVQRKYQDYYCQVSEIVNNQQKLNWNDFTKEEKLATQNAILLVGLLYKMCQVKLVEQSKNQDELNKINKDLVTESISNAEHVLEDIA